MNNKNKLTITDLRELPGDAAFLIDDGTTSILYDTGFGFTANQIVRKIRAQLGTRPLDYIFLTHSHYDHALGCAAISKSFPMAKVVAAGYAKQIFEKPSAQRIMLEMDQKAASQYGITEYPQVPQDIHVDIAVEDGDILVCGNLRFTVIALPGHTKCSIGFYCPDHKLLLAVETLGVRCNDTYFPSFLVGYQMTLDSCKKIKNLEIQRLLIPHYGAVDNDEAAIYLHEGKEITIETAQIICSLLRSGHSHQEILDLFTREYFPVHVRQVYPIDAFLLNTSIMIRQVEKELM